MQTWSKPIVLFDVDKTLIDTGVLFKKFVISELVKQLGITENQYAEKEAAYKQSLEKYTDFEPISFLKSISHLEDVTKLASQTLFNRNFHEQSVFTDVIPTLAELSESYTLGVFSEANLAWQQQKLELAGLHHFFEPELTFIWHRKTAPDQLKLLPTNVVIVDDNTEVIADLQTVLSITPIWINRTAKPPLSDVITITSLSELKPVLATLGKNA